MSLLLGKSNYNGRQAPQAACDVSVATTEQTTCEYASEQNEENTKQIGSVQSTEIETPTLEGVGDVEEEDDDADDNDDAKTGLKQSGKVAEKAETQLLLSENKQEEERVEQETGSIGCTEQNYAEHATTADNEPTTEQDAAETKSEFHGPSGQDNAVTSEPHPGAADLVSESDTDDRDKDRDPRDNDAAGAQSQERSEKPKTETEMHENLSHIEKQEDGLENKIGGSETDTGNTVSAANLDFTEDNDKPLAAGIGIDEQSKLEAESKNIGVSTELETQAENSCKEAVETKVQSCSDDDIKPVSETNETERYQSVRVQSPAGYAEYHAAGKTVKERLKKTTERPNDNSLLNSLRFYTREEEMDEYFCLTCNEGRILLHFITICRFPR